MIYLFSSLKFVVKNDQTNCIQIQTVKFNEWLSESTKIDPATITYLLIK